MAVVVVGLEAQKEMEEFSTIWLLHLLYISINKI